MRVFGFEEMKLDTLRLAAGRTLVLHSFINCFKERLNKVFLVFKAKNKIIGISAKNFSLRLRIRPLSR